MFVPVQQPRRGVGQVDWGKIFEKSVDGTFDILSARFALPPAGTSIQRGADGSTSIVRAQTGVPLTFQSFPSDMNLGPWLLIGGLAIGGIALLGGRR